jgi:hypothetical protein
VKLDNIKRLLCASLVTDTGSPAENSALLIYGLAHRTNVISVHKLRIGTGQLFAPHLSSPAPRDRISDVI